MPIRVVEFQATPNPNAVKFVIDRGQAAGETVSLRKAESVVGDSEVSVGEGSDGQQLARQLLAIPEVAAVLLLSDFVTINKSPKGSWADIKRQVKRVLKAWPDAMPIESESANSKRSTKRR